MALSNKQRAFVEYYIACWDGTKAAIQAGYSPHTAAQQASRLLKNVNIQALIKERVSEIAMSANEVLTALSEQARADIGQFYKVVEEWTFYPLPTYDILDAEEVEDDTDPDNPRKRINYLVRHVALDTDKLTDPRYSRLLQKVSDTPRGGIEIEIYNKQNAIIQLGKYHRLFTDKQEITGKDGGPIETKVTDGLSDSERVDRLVAILDAARARRDRSDSGE